MARVKMNARHEYEYIANYKILQTVFKSHKLDKVRLVVLYIHQITGCKNFYL